MNLKHRNLDGNDPTGSRDDGIDLSPSYGGWAAMTEPANPTRRCCGGCGDISMSRFQCWWVNADYDQDHMRRFYETHPDWSDMPPEVVANSMTFQLFAVGEAGHGVWVELKKALGIIC